MALATKCPHCNTIFRVAADQLKLRGGIVRCGSCKEVFDGNAALVDPAAVAAAPAAPATVPTAAAESPSAFTAPAVADVPPEPAASAASAVPVVPAVPAIADIPPEHEPAVSPEAAPLPEVPRAAPGSSPLDDRLAPLDARAAQLPPASGSDAGYTLDFDTAVDAFDLPPKPAPAAETPAPAPTPAAAVDAAEAVEPAPAAPTIDFELDFELDTPAVAAAPPSDKPAKPDEQDQQDEPVEGAKFIDAHEPATEEFHLAPLPLHGDERREPSFHFEAFELPEHPHGHADLHADLHDETHADLHEPQEQLIAAALPDASPFDEALQDETAAAAEVDADAAALDSAETDLSDAGGSEHVSRRGAAWAARVHGDDTEAEPAEATESHPEEHDEPGFVRQGRRRERTGRAVNLAMGIGSLLLLFALLAQGMGTFRNQLAAFVPALKPALVSACATLGCRIELPSQIDALSIEQGELQTLADNTFSYASLLHNQSASAQAWPSIELTLNDAQDKPVLRRVVAPRDYLAANVDIGKGFAPHSEQSVKLYFELAQLKASGYHIAVFYP
jgi:predicted Zn finger-like uncharacterized protein